MEKLSVILPVYNGERYIREAIESILLQTHTNLELILINDGSTDSSLEIIKNFTDSRIVLIDQNNQGLVKSLNNGIIKSQSNFIARMDADDISIETRLDTQIKFLLSHPSAAMVGTQADIISEEGEYLYTSKSPLVPNKIREYLKTKSPFFHGSVMFRKDALFDVGLYDENVIHFIEDLLLWKKLSIKYELYNLDKVLYKYRLCHNSLSNRPKKIEKKMFSLCNLIVLEENSSIKANYYSEMENLFSRIKKTPQSKLHSNYHLTIGRILLTRTKLVDKGYNHLKQALRLDPLNFKIYYYFILFFLRKLNEKN